MLGYQPWLCMKHNLIADVVKPRWFLKIVCSKQFAFFTYELSKGQSLTSSRANCVHECVSYCCNSVHCSVDYCVIMHQSIPAAPSFPLPPPSLSIRCFWGERGKMEAKKGESLRLPPPRATAGHLSALPVPGVGDFQILHCPGICQPRGHSWAFDTHAVSQQKTTTQKVLLEKK